MGGINFLYKTTHIPYTWANAVNISVYNAIGDGTNTPTTPADVRTNLGLPTSSGASYIGNNTAGGSAGSTVQAALDFKAPLASPSFTGNVHSAGTIYADATGTAMQTAGNIIVQGYVWAVGQPAVFDQFPGGFASTAGHFSRNAGSGAGPQPINGPMFVHDVVTSGATSFEWNQLNLLENSSGVGENVSFYAQAYKKGAGSTWAGVFEAHDTTHTQPSGALFCLELDMSANGSDISPLGFSQRYGVLLVGYRDDGYFASFSGRISGTTMTIDTMYAGSISKGSMITTSGVTAGTWVTAFGSGSGQAGTYTVNNSQTVTTQQLNTMQPIATGYVGTGSDANVTASITTTVLTVTAINGNGIIAVGMTVVGITSAVTAGTVITSLGTGTGGTGTYNINNSQTVASSTIELGAVANAVLTITAAYPSANNFGAIYVGASVFGRGLPDGTTVASFGTGSGGTGTYNLTIPANLWQSGAATAVASLQGFIFGGGAANRVGNGIWIGSNFTDPAGTHFANMINLTGNGDIGITMNGYLQYGLSFTGYYSSAPIQISTTSTPLALINLLGTQNTPAFMSFQTPNAMFNQSAAGTYNGRIPITIDGAVKYIHVFNA